MYKTYNNVHTDLCISDRSILDAAKFSLLKYSQPLKKRRAPGAGRGMKPR